MKATGLLIGAGGAAVLFFALRNGGTLTVSGQATLAGGVPPGTPGSVLDAFGNSVILGVPFFSSPLGITMLKGTAGDYFSAADLAGNPWGLNAKSVISNSQYAQRKADLAWIAAHPTPAVPPPPVNGTGLSLDEFNQEHAAHPDWNLSVGLSPAEANQIQAEHPDWFVPGATRPPPPPAPLPVTKAPPAAIAPAPLPIAAPPPAQRPIAKLGNADPAFQSWLNTEISQLIGPISGTAPFRQRDADFLRGAITNRHIPDYYKNSPGDCGAPPQLGTFGAVLEGSSVAGLGVSAAELGAKIAGASISALPIVGAAIGIFETGYQLAFGHHQQAVKVEQNTLCNAVPLANQYMDQFDAAYRAGQISGIQLDAALEALFTKFLELIDGIVKPRPFSIQTAEQKHQCNAACVYARALRGIIDAKIRFDY